MTYAIGRFSDGATCFPGVIADESLVYDLSDLVATTRELFEREDGVDRAIAYAKAGHAGRPLDQLTVLAPIEPRQVIQAGANYRKHVIDLMAARGTAGGQDEQTARADAARIMDARIANGEPYLFLGAVSAICGPDDDIVLPTHGSQHDWELELAVVIGADGQPAGYTIANDITTRDLVLRSDLKEIGADWLRSKNAPTFLPVGPWIVPARYVPDPTALVITLSHNGDVMQNERVEDMIFGIERLLDYARDSIEVLPGDLLLTGSPAGNGAHWNRFLASGDLIESTITGLGRQRNRCVAGEGGA